MSNGSSTTLADIVLEVSIVEERRRGHVDTPRRVLAGPFAIRGTTVLDPGYTADYEILLRNISATCRCAANVRVLSFRSIEGSGPSLRDSLQPNVSHDTQEANRNTRVDAGMPRALVATYGFLTETLNAAFDVVAASNRALFVRH